MPDPVATTLPVRPANADHLGQELTILPNDQTPAPQIPSGVDQQETPPAAYELGRYASIARPFLRGLHLRGKLLPLLREAHVEQAVRRRAEELGIDVSTAELRAGMDDYRAQLNIHSADQTMAWLHREHLTTADLEDIVRRDLLTTKVRDNVTAGKVQKRFDEDPSRYDRVRVRHVASVQEELPHEFLGEVTNAVRNLANVRPESLSESAANDSGSQVVYRFQLPPNVAAALFAAPPGAIVGPVEIAPGRHFFRHDKFEPARLDAATVGTIRDELFNHWIDDQSLDVAIDADFLYLL